MEADITSLEGYESLRQSFIDRLHKKEADEPRWVFESDQDINLSLLVKDRRQNQTKRNGHTDLNGFEQVEKILLGRVFDLNEEILLGRVFDLNGENENYDWLREQDEEWVKNKLKSLINNEMSSDIEAFADRHEIDISDVKEALREDDELEFNEVFEYSLHQTKLSYSGSIPVKIDLGITASLAPGIEMASCLCTLKISPQSWIGAVNKAVQFDSSIASQFSVDKDEVFDPQEFVKNLSAHVSVLSARGFVFETDASKALVEPTALLERMINDWNVEQAELVLCFNLGSTHVDEVSMPVARTLESHEVDKTMLLLMDDVELMPMEDYESGKGTGLILRHPYACKIEDIKISSSDQDDRPEPTVRLAGAIGMLMRSYEILLESEDSQKAIELAGNHRSDSKKLKSEVPFEMPLATAEKLRKLYADADGFDAERIGAKYPGLSRFIEPIAPMTPKVMGQKLLDILSVAMDESANNWGASENRERAAWLVAQGADLGLRLNEVSKAGKSVKGKTGPQAVHLAASIGDLDLVRSMHSRGADVCASYRPQMAVDGQDLGVWEACIRRAVSYRTGDKSADVAQLTHIATWLESLGGGQVGMQISADQKITSSTIVGQHSTLISVDKAVAIVDDTVLSGNYLARLKQEDASFGGEKLARALLIGMNENSINFSRACLDAGARTDTLIGSNTVEAIARKNIENTWNGKSNTAIDDAVAYGNALIAREAIDDLMSLTAAMSTAKPRSGTSSAYSSP